MKTAISTPNAPSAPNYLSQAIEHDGLIFVSGQIHKLPDGGLVGETMAEKTTQVMHNIAAILRAANVSFDQVVKVTVYLTDMTQYEAFNKRYIDFFQEPLPAREVVGVKELPLGASLEVSVIAKK